MFFFTPAILADQIGQITHFLFFGQALIIADLLKQFLNKNERSDLYFWRDAQGHEIDCIIERSMRTNSIEIKAGKTIASDYFDNLQYFSILTKSNNNYVICAGSESHRWPNAHVMNWQRVGQLLDEIE